MKTLEQTKQNFIGTEPAPRSRSYFWDADTPDAKIAADLEAGGYTRAKAGDDFPRVLAAVRAMLKGEIDGLILNGKTGCGKTTAAKAIALHALDSPKLNYAFLGEEPNPDEKVSFDDSVLVECGHQDVIAAAVPDEEHPHASLARPDWAVLLDDFGAEHPVKVYGNSVDPVAAFIFRWDEFEHKRNRRGRLLITTNLDAEKIRIRYDDRVLSRLVARCGWLSMNAPDHRLERLRKF